MQQVICCLATALQKLLAHHGTVSPAQHWAAWKETGTPKQWQGKMIEIEVIRKVTKIFGSCLAIAIISLL